MGEFERAELFCGELGRAKLACVAAVVGPGLPSTEKLQGRPGRTHMGAEIRSCAQAMQGENQRTDAVRLHALGFGRHVDSSFMSEIASIGNGSFHTITEVEDVGR